MSSTKASGFDKLERLFAKKTGSGFEASSLNNRSSGYASSSVSLSLFVSRKSSLANAAPESPTEPMSLDDVHFPEPSFMCPKTIKMTPRDDRILVRPGRPSTGRSMSVSDAPIPASAGAPPAMPNLLRSGAPTGPRVGAPFTRSPLGPPACLSTTQARSMSLANTRSTSDSRRSSCNTNSSAAFSSGSSYNSSTDTCRSFVSAVQENGDSASHTASDDELLADSNTTSQRLPNSSSLLQRRDLSLAPLNSFDNFQIDQSKRNSASVTIHSGEISPATIHQATPKIGSDSTLLPTVAQPELTIVSDEDLHNLQELSELVAKAKEELKPEPAETALRCRESVCAPICLPQNPPSPSSSPRRRLRSMRRSKSQRYKRHLPSEPAPSSPSSVLMEPNLGDFLSLGDDDIAEDVPAAVKRATLAAHNAHIIALTSRSLPPTPRAANGSPPISPAPKCKPVAPSRSPSLQAPSPPTYQAPLPPSFQAPSPCFLAPLPGMPTSPGGCPRTPVGDSRMAAAFEIARIASRYQFDLAYVATIWPKNMAYQRSAAAAAAAASMQTVNWPASPLSQMAPSTPLPMKPATRSNSRASRVSHVSQKSYSSTADNSLPPPSPRQTKLAFQFLAAFGLATVKTPYTLLAPMHQRLLNAKQKWTELSRPDFAQGFGCAFHCGHAPVMASTPPQREWRPSTAEDCDADTEQDSSPSGCTTPRPTFRDNRTANSSSTRLRVNNRGIVFVAYRQKSVVDERAARGEKDDLEALHRDVEALVQTFYDAHNQQNQA